MGSDRWASRALALLDAERLAAVPTPVLRFDLPAGWGVELLLKDESAHPTGTLKHRSARALFRHAIASGQLTESGVAVEATGGTGALAQAHFARLLGVRHVVVVPGRHRRVTGFTPRFFTPPAGVHQEARRLAAELGGHHLDQQSNAARVVDWRGDDLAGELFAQVGEPDWVVVGAGTRATSASLGRHVRERGLRTGLAVVDPEHSAHFPGWVTGAPDYATGMPSRIEGIGRPAMGPGFLPGVADLVIPVPDAASVAGARLVRARTGLAVGGSTGTNLWGALHLVARLRERGGGRVVTLVCDAAERHLATYHDDGWARDKSLLPGAHAAVLEEFLAGGPWRWGGGTG
ncbi:pyridoxal-phosphate dependent enzyme [Actinosynnema pretiosum subsp. pretiosum]|uniref:Pyridoxal-phosphate dependent enzyme n=1 Tax=Actinosynnema pretiosum subsp. pretiosum TaxID=103721 RepID=A0AA45R4D1_9PSEU|nr:Cysteine synthase B [Actinosynnema pretiosum subsp. pretiosum]QUF04771.1 pyridoxal-phosphate dependent enzyme [Actinosynnema pretiosum subsp. pretiosum]